MKRRTWLKAAIGGAVLGSGAGWIMNGRLREYATAGLAFGTTISMRVLHDDEHSARVALQAAMAAVRDVDQLMSLYRADSQLSQLNRHGALAAPAAPLLAVLQKAQEVSALTDGAFDVTVQPLWQAANGQADPADALRHVGWRRLQVSAEQVRFQAPGMAVTLNGIAQGYGADVALAQLRAHGIRHALLDTGELATLGERDDGQPWTLAVRDPRDADRAAALLAADGRCLASSGDYATTFSADFSRHHIVDPRSGTSPQELAAVSVLAPSGIEADALSTACMVMGAEKSLQLAARLPGVDLLCITKAGAQWRSAGFPSLPAA